MLQKEPMEVKVIAAGVVSRERGMGLSAIRRHEPLVKHI